ncbi:unnamed protein product [Oikopleura dioica]|uniref:PDZ domain-containing protein n=1 Tax=Oikopleura dioica TaxID=34765 RepID=E4WVA3_OIKDI|nr:unnamed protein product [Oikopleura dioica]
MPSPNPSQTAQPVEIRFDCQLAHGGPVCEVKNFRNIKELYFRMAEAIGVDVNKILFVTVNTEKCDMTKLLGGQIMFGDFLYCHVSAPTTTVINVQKVSQMFGLTITDNGNGQAFVKGKRAGSVVEHNDDILPGDAILSINDEVMIGKRHIDVARKLRDVPIGSMVQFVLQPPVRGFNMVGGRSKAKVSGDINKGGMTVRIKANGDAEVVEGDKPCKRSAIEIIDQMLEDYVGIRDRELSLSIYESGTKSSDSGSFLDTVTSAYPMFAFTDQFILDVWNIISDAESGVMPKKPT